MAFPVPLPPSRNPPRRRPYPDGVVLAARHDPAGRRSQHRDGLLVSALHGARQLAADHVLAAVARGRRDAAPPGTT